MHSLEIDEDEGYISNRIVIDQSLALSEGIHPLHLSQTIFSASTGSVINEFLIGGEKVDVFVGLDKKDDFDSKDILNLKVRNKRDQAMPIGSFAEVKEEPSNTSIQRWNGLNITTLFGEVNESLISGFEANQKVKPLIEKLKKENSGLRIELGGEEKERKKALRDLIPLYFIAILLIFFILSLSFNSNFFPFLVLIAIPMGFSGMIWALSLHGQILSLMSLIGVVGLSGIVVNNSIILLKTIQKNMKEGENLKDVLVLSAVRRLRPIILTSCTTLLGLFPTIYGLGQGVDLLIQPVALVIAWGLLASTLLILLCMPSLTLLAFSLTPTIKKKLLHSKEHE